MQPTTNLYQWFETRGAEAALGNSVQPHISFAPSGQARGLQPYWPMQKANIAPHLSFAYSPNVGQGFWHKLFGNAGDSVLRAGYGKYYDHFGESIVNLFDQYGSYGLSDSITNPTNVLTPDTSPRYTGAHNIPDLTGAPEQNVSYPALSPTDPLTTGFAITHGIDSQMQTPYAHVVNVSLQRAAARRLRSGSGVSGTIRPASVAANRSSAAARSGRSQIRAGLFLCRHATFQRRLRGQTNVAAIPYFEDMFPDAASGGVSATQNIYNSHLEIQSGQ